MFASLASLLTLVAILLAAYGAGRPLVRAWRLEMDDPCALAVWSVSLGLIAFGVLWMGLGCVGLLYRELIAVFTVAAASWGIGEIVQTSIHRRSCPERRAKANDELGSRAPRSGLKLLGACCLIALLASLTSALAPPTAGDALCYHLELPKRFLQEHHLAYLPDHENSTFPLLVEMWYLWALALDGGVAAQLVHWALGGLLAMAAVLLARSVVGRDWAWFAGGLVLLAPGVTNQMTAPLNDAGLAVFTTLAVAAWWRAAIDDDGSRWYLVAGLMLGGAVGAKYLALLFGAAWFAVWLGMAWRDRERERAWLQGAAVMLVLAAAVGGPWYARAAYFRGNPVYPFFQTAIDENASPTIRESKLSLGRTPWGLLAAPWAVTMHPEDFGGRGHQLGAAFLTLLPGLLIARRLRGVRVLLAISGLYFLGCFLLRQNVRFLFPLASLWAAPCVWVGMELRRAPRFATAGVAFAVILLSAVGTLWPAYRARQHWPVAVGMESREHYLERTEPTYRAALLANILTDGGAKILSQDNHGFYFDAAMTQESLYRRRTKYDTISEDLATQLRRDGFSYLLLADATGAGIQYDDTLSELAEQTLASPNQRDFHSIASYRFRDADGAERSYRLVRVEPEQFATQEKRRH
jgi:hypothetical protein